MTPQQIDRFFRTLAREYPHSATVIVTGAAAAALWGHVRPSLDIDFSIRTGQRSPSAWSELEQAIDRTVRLTGIRVNYAEDIDRWSSVSLMDYRRHTMPHRRFASLEVRLLDPTYWSIGKLSRYLEPDVNDLVNVVQRWRIRADRLIQVWGRAVRRSPRSLALTQFCRQAEHFFRASGPTIWGNTFDADRAIAKFRRAIMPR